MSKHYQSPERIMAFEAVMRHGSLSAAARHLGLSQPTVRRCIAALETDVGVRLFTRSDNGLMPTDRAHSLLPLARSLVELTYAFARTASVNDEDVSGSLRVTASRVVAHYLMPGALKGLIGAFPALTVQLVADDLTGDLLRRDADVAVRMAPPRQAQLAAQKVKPIELGLFGAASFSIDPENKTPISVYLERAPFIWEDRSRFLSEAASALALPQPSKVSVATDDQALQIALIAAGAGVGICQVGIAKALGLNRLAADWSYELPVWIVAHEDQIGARHIRTTFDWLVRYFNEL